MRWMACALMVWLAGCLDRVAVRCEDGRLCPTGTVCDDLHDRCVLPEQLTVCGGDPDGTSCAINEATAGICRDDVCLVPFCGDGFISGAEECDGTLLGEVVDCRSLDYYDDKPITCNASCRYDREACTGWCGDLEINGPGVEACDGPPPTTDTCLDFGFDAGALGCSAFCTPDFSACHRLGWRRTSDAIDVPGYIAIAGTAPDRVFAGAQGLIRRWNGITWTLSASLEYRVSGLWAAPDGQVFAVNDAGEAAHGDGTSWAWQSIVTPFTNLNAVSGTSSSDVWVVGERGTIRHWNGASWSDHDLAQPFALQGVWARATSDAWAVGYLGVEGTVFRFDGQSWDEVPGVPPNRGFTDIWGSGPDDVYVTGGAGVLLHWNGTSWRTIRLATQAAFTAVSGTGPADVYVVGTEGIAYHFDGVSWIPMITGSTDDLHAVWRAPGGPLFAGSRSLWQLDGDYWAAVRPVAPAHLVAIGGTSAAEVFAVGSAGTALHFDGSRWKLTETGTSHELYAVWQRHVVGDVGTLLVWNGTSWTTITTGTSERLRDVWGSGPDDIYVVGGDGAAVVRHFDGAAWSALTIPGLSWAYVVWGSGPDDVYVVGSDSMAHWDGASWQLLALPISPTNDLWGFAPDDIWAIGDNGDIRHFNGSVWEVHDVLASGSFQSIWGPSTNNLTIATGGGTFYQWSGSAWFQFDSPRPASAFWGIGSDRYSVGNDLELRRNSIREIGPAFYDSPPSSLWAIGTDDVYAVFSGQPYHFDGTLWSSLELGDSSNNYESVWASGPDSVFFAGDRIERWDGSAWIDAPIPGGHAAAGTSASDVWLGGIDDAMVHFDGTGYTAIAAPGASTTTIEGLWAASSTFAVGVGIAGIWRWDGTTWSQSEVTEPLRGVWGTASDDLFAVGPGGTVLHHDGIAWTELYASTTVDLLAVSGGGSEDVFAVGAEGVIVHWDGDVWSPVRAPAAHELGAVSVSGSSVYMVGRSSLLRLYRRDPW